jgi:SAM-dependent methyltransferase
MKSPETWQQSKVVYSARTGRYLPNPDYVLLGSRYLVRLIGTAYERVIRAHARGRLLDLGCGDVPYYAMYREQVSDVFCVDWSASTHGRQHIDLEANLNDALPLADQSFDTVLLADVLEHIHEPERLLAEIRRLLVPSGKLLCMTPFLYQVHEGPHDYYRYTRFALERLCTRAGLCVVELTPYGGYPDVAIDLISKGLAYVPPLCQLLLAITPLLTSNALFRRWRAGSAERFPLGYCLVAERA